MIKIAIVGIGNCASSLIQGLSFYRNNPQETIGLMYPVLGGYKISDIEVMTAFDVNETKVGKDLNEAIYANPNNTKVFAAVEKTGVIVQNVPVMEGDR